MALFVNQRQYAERFNSQQVQSLLVVFKRNALPRDLFVFTFLLLQLKDVAHEELLQLLIGIIYAQLLKTTNAQSFQRYTYF